VQTLQDQYRLVPLAAWGTDWTPPSEAPVQSGVDTTTSVPRQILAMGADSFFERLNALLVGNPPYEADAPVMERIAQLGIGPGAAFPWDDFGPEVQRAITGGVEAGKQAIHDQDELAPGPGRGPLQARAPALLTQAPGRPRLLATPSDRTRALGARHPAFRSAESGSGPPRTVHSAATHGGVFVAGVLAGELSRSDRVWRCRRRDAGVESCGTHAPRFSSTYCELADGTGRCEQVEEAVTPKR
jgi:hypothetical protein